MEKETISQIILIIIKALISIVKATKGENNEKKS